MKDIHMAPCSVELVEALEAAAMRLMESRQLLEMLARDLAGLRGVARKRDEWDELLDETIARAQGVLAQAKGVDRG